MPAKSRRRPSRVHQRNSGRLQRLHNLMTPPPTDPYFCFEYFALDLCHVAMTILFCLRQGLSSGTPVTWIPRALNYRQLNSEHSQRRISGEKQLPSIRKHTSQGEGNGSIS